MQESYSENLASYAGPESYAGGGDTAGVATTGVHTGKLLSSEITPLVRRRHPDVRKATPRKSLTGEICVGTAESKNLSMCGNSKRENREIRSARKATPIIGAELCGGQGTTEWVSLS
jgi:hypothetical protein